MSARTTATRLLVPAALVPALLATGAALAPAASAGAAGGALRAVQAGTATVCAGSEVAVGTSVRPGDVISVRRAAGALPALRTPSAAQRDAAATVGGLHVRTVTVEQLRRELDPTLRDALDQQVVSASTAGGTSATVRPTRLPRTPDGGRLAATAVQETRVTTSGASTGRTTAAVRSDARRALGVARAELTDLRALRVGTGAHWTGVPGSGSLQVLRGGGEMRLHVLAPATSGPVPSCTEVAWTVLR
jgi:hypothetical protein